MYMTLREALEIQARQVAHYSKFRSDLVVHMAKLTDVGGCDLDAPMDIVEVNKRVPRGADIEYECGFGVPKD